MQSLTPQHAPNIYADTIGQKRQTHRHKRAHTSPAGCPQSQHIRCRQCPSSARQLECLVLVLRANTNNTHQQTANTSLHTRTKAYSLPSIYGTRTTSISTLKCSSHTHTPPHVDLGDSHIDSENVISSPYVPPLISRAPPPSQKKTRSPFHDGAGLCAALKKKKLLAYVSKKRGDVCSKNVNNARPLVNERHVVYHVFRWNTTTYCHATQNFCAKPMTK